MCTYLPFMHMFIIHINIVWEVGSLLKLLSLYYYVGETFSTYLFIYSPFYTCLKFPLIIKTLPSCGLVIIIAIQYFDVKNA